MKLEGLLVDLVPFGDRFLALEHRWHNGPGVFYWAVGGQWFVTRAQTKANQRETAEEIERGEPRVRFGVQTKDGTPIGLFGVADVSYEHRLALLTAIIGEPEYWGGGYGTDALLLVLEYAFDWLDTRKVWLMTMSLNPRVMRQMDKVGFQLEGRRRESTWAAHQWADFLIYGLLRDEWPGRAALLEKLGLHGQEG